MEYSCTLSELDPNTSESGISLCCGQCISSGGREVAESFLFPSFSSRNSSHKIQVQRLSIVQVYGWTPWKIDLLFWNPQFSFHQLLVDKGWGPTEGKDHLFCLIVLDSPPTLQCQVSSRADLQGWLAWTCHILSGYQAQISSVQAGFSPPGRSRRGQEQKEEDSLPCQESGGSGGGITLSRLHCHLQ